MRSFSACWRPCWSRCGAGRRAGLGAPSRIFRCGRCVFPGGLPELHVCLGCGSVLDDREAPERAFFSRGRAGLMCGHCRGTLAIGSSWELSAESRAIAAEMLRRPVAGLSTANWTQSTAADLRRFLVQQIESHAERRLITAPLLEEGLAGPLNLRCHPFKKSSSS